jgi:hypothetical protein
MPPEGIPITLSPVSLSIQRDLQEFRGIFHPMSEYARK